MILADDDEPAVQNVWEKRFRKRLAAASEIFEHYCRVRFEVVAVSTWVSDNNIREFEKSLEEFERKVNPLPARLAIGFTSQYQKIQGRRHLGGTHGPLRPHILIREWSQEISEPERLEVLVHEMGHFLGAAHTPDDRSVMRPVLGDRRSRARSFRIGFDPSNALVMYLIGEELRSLRTGQLASASAGDQNGLAPGVRRAGQAHTRRSIHGAVHRHARPIFPTMSCSTFLETSRRSARLDVPRKE